MTEGQVIKFMCVFLLCPGVGIETVALAAKYMIYIYIYVIRSNVKLTNQHYYLNRLRGSRQ